MALRSYAVRASLERWKLRQPISREVVVTDGTRLDVLGGLASGDVTTSEVLSVDPATGGSRPEPGLAKPSHDAGGAVVAGQPMLFGGGSATTQPWIQRRTPSGRWKVVGTLPTPRSDLSAAAVGNSAYVVGGYDGVRIESTVLRVSSTGAVKVVGRLPVPVRYAAVAAVNGALWVIGGRGPSGPTDVIQRFEISTGRASVVGHLAVPLEGASAVVLAGQVYLCGGVPAGRAATARILRVNPSTGRVTRAGRLPRPVSYAGAVQLGGVAFVVGGESPATSADVIRLRLAPGAAALRRTH